MADQGKPQGTLTTSQLKTIKVVAIDSTALDPKDKEILCRAICYCNYNPNKGKKQNNLYQSCVSERLKEMDEMMFNQSPYKPEITYDMHTDPPSPIMDKNILTKGHEYVWGWIKKNWLNDKGYEYEKGQGMSRRPDVVIVKDPNLPPTQDNIKHVVEIKFGTDTFEKPQRDAYTEIAGDRTKVKVLDPDECGCNSDDDGKKSTVTEWATAAVATLVALAQLRKGKIPKMPKFPSPAF
jgi:hypothetical protein